MKIVKTICCLLFLLLLTASFVFTQKSSEKYADGELLVKFKNGTASSAAVEAANEIGASVLERFPELKWQRIKLPAGMSVERAVLRYKNMAEVEAVQPNFYYRLAAPPNDTRFSELYGLTKISAPAAWELSTGSASTVVAVIDTGIKYNHEDLAANIWTNPGEINGNGIDDDGNGFVDDFYGYDFFFNDSDPSDEHGHGTHVAGTIGAVGNNNLGVVGVNWNVRMMTIKIYDRTGFGTTSAMLINAYNYVRMMKTRGVNIRVTNNSYSGCDEACGYDQATKDALDAMGDTGILNVFAAGNDARNVDTATPVFPASYKSPSILSAAASTQTDDKASFSNFGATSVDLAAPGTGILSTHHGVAGYATFSGTSMASPHAAGAAALLSSHNPTLSNASLKATLMNTADRLAQWNGVVKTGGRLNVERALKNQTVCNFTLDRTSQRVFPEGGTFSLIVTAPPNCDFSAVSSAGWITITSENPGSGNGAVTFSVEYNTPGSPRAGTIMVAGQTFTVAQNPSKIFPRRGYLDFDGDGRTDYIAIENANGGMFWHSFGLAGYHPVNFGLFNEDIAVPALYDGDLKNDFAVWRDSTGTFYVLRSEDNTFQAARFGAPGDNPRIAQDFDGDQKADFAVTRRSGDYLFWYVLSTTGGFRAVQFGLATDVPVRGDFDGDGRADPAVFRPSNGFWYILQSSGGFAAVNFGLGSDRLVPADYDGDGKTDIAVWRPEDGFWHYLKSSDGSYNSFQFGQIGDLPTAGDYDGDSRFDFSVWRPNQSANESGVFYKYSVWTGFNAFGWGNSTMKIPANTLQNP